MNKANILSVSLFSTLATAAFSAPTVVQKCAGHDADRNVEVSFEKPVNLEEQTMTMFTMNYSENSEALPNFKTSIDGFAEMVPLEIFKNVRNIELQDGGMPMGILKLDPMTGNGTLHYADFADNTSDPHAPRSIRTIKMNCSK